ncbi:hypothetical protein [Paenibacillus monticola]|uniref:Uncharacterized protein n=1 Tax=Paenibacillus monticola TaxID=2666075 RepID=A0A7X2H9T3_9BACL|nr:hypothetical protein [Paenibacillus monticola]MRN55488.1 hypothetical protein [Paenibacillus monticola]
MPDPLPTEAAYSATFTEYVQKYSGAILTLSSLLLEESTEAEQITVSTFTELYKPNRRAELNPQLFPILAYRSCIHHCAGLTAGRVSRSAKDFTWDEQIVKSLWYGMKLSLPEISTILQKSVPVLKAQLRHVREEMAAQGNTLPNANLSAV